MTTGFSVCDGGRGRRRLSAQAIVELALIAPILILLAMAAWDGGGALREQVILQSAARDGARVAAAAYGPGTANLVCTQPATVSAAVRASAADLPQIQNTPNYLCVTYPDAKSVKVVVRYNHSLFTPVLRNMWGSGSGVVSLQAAAVFYSPSLTQVPATIVASTPLPTPTPTFTATPSPTRTPIPPTLTATATLVPVTPTATPTPGSCTRPIPVPALAIGKGYYFTFSTAASGIISTTWTLPAGVDNESADVYHNNPFLGQPNPDSVNPPNGAIADDQQQTGSYVRSTTPSEPAGTYTVYFFNNSGSVAEAATTATLTYVSARCP